MSDPKIYTISLICALTTEYVAAQAFLDEEHVRPEYLSPQNESHYTLGRIGYHNVVISVLPLGEYGTSSAARVALDMLHSFPNIRFGLMVGIGGGAPSPGHDIRLGDIVVGIPYNGQDGVIQCDLGKTIQGQSVQGTSFLNRPPTILLAAVNKLQSQYAFNGHRLEEAVNEVLNKRPTLRKKYKRPKPESDRLYQSQVVHKPGSSCAIACGNDSNSLVLRTPRSEDEGNPAIHYGLILSANQVLKDARLRDRLAAEMGALCFEMEAAGMMNNFPCLVVRGICDYSDSHKNKEWQGYAAMVATAYVKDILYQIHPQLVKNEERVLELLKSVIDDAAKLQQDLDESDVESIRSMDEGFHTKPKLSDLSAAKHSQQSPERADPTSGEPTKDYPLSNAAVTVTENSAFSQDLWSSRDAREMVNISTTGTSVDLGGQQMDQDPADNESIYTSDVPRSLAFVQKLAKSFFKDSETPEAESLERVRESLPDLLRGFAQRIGGENHASVHFEVMKFVNKKRVDIATSFRQYYLDDAEKLQRQNLNDMSLHELFGRWHVDQVMDDPNSATARPDDVPPTDDDGQLDGDDDDDDNDVDDAQFVMYQNVVANSTAFQWLLYRLHRETNLTTSEASSVKAISTHIRQILYTRRENRLVSSRKGPPKFSVLFQSDWDPLVFIHNQEYTEEPEEAIEGAIVIVQGTNGDVEAMPCSEYVGRTWPLFGEHFMELVKHTVRSKPGLRCSVTLFDSTKITAWVEPSGCFFLEAGGVVETLVEVGEVFAFIVAALRSARGDSVASVTPTIDSDAKTSDQTCRLAIRIQYSDGPLRSTGQCWQDLFRNPVVVLGFPVRRRRPDQGPGLEISLVTLAALVGTRRIAVFCGKVFLQGFCTMLVPTKYTGDTVHWHVLCNENGSRIPFTDFRVRKIVKGFDLSKHLTLSGVETARHIVGWCEHVRNYAGSRDASYDIHKTGLRQPDSRFAFDRVSISAGKIVSVGGSVAIGKKDKPARAAKTTDYHKQLEWAEERFIVLYDCKDRRAWLIDGLSALLHLVRARLAHRRKVGREVLFSEGDIKEPDTPYTGKTAANAVFRNRANMDLKIYEKWNRIVEETSKKGDEPPETNQKTQKTWEQLPDLVGDIYITLGMLFDIQTDTLTADGFGAKVRKSPRRHLEGWDFQQVATGADLLLPKAALLRDIGLGWVDLIRAINAIILFGVGFGEILQPVDAAQVFALGGECLADSAQPGPAANASQGTARCDRWAILPRGEDLLATTTPVIRDIMESVYRDPDNKQCLWELFTDIYWHSPDKVFEDCHCGTASSGTHCDRVQVLLPTKFPKLFVRGFHSPPEPLPAHGAVIFGHSVNFPLIWKWEACSVPTEGYLQSPELTSRSSHQSDSGLGTSVASPSVHEESVSGVSIPPPPSSGSSHGGAASSVNLALVTGPESNTTWGKGNSAANIVQRLFKKTRPGTKSVKTPRDPGRS